MTDDQTKPDRRLLRGEARGEPDTGQSAAARLLTWKCMNADERAVAALLSGATGSPRVVRSIPFLAEGLSGERTGLRVRNALRRLVSCGWAVRVARGKYQVTESGRRKIREMPE